MSLRVHQRERRPRCFDLLLEGRLDTETHQQLEMKLDMLLAGDAKVIHYDLSKLAYMSSAGLRVLLRTAKEMRKVGGEMILTNPQPQIRAVIEVAKALPGQAIFQDFDELDAYLDEIQRNAT